MSKRGNLHISAKDRLLQVVLSARQCGGFTVGRPIVEGKSETIAAFDRLDGALEWLRSNMAKPVGEAS